MERITALYQGSPVLHMELPEPQRGCKWAKPLHPKDKNLFKWKKMSKDRCSKTVKGKKAVIKYVIVCKKSGWKSII